VPLRRPLMATKPLMASTEPTGFRFSAYSVLKISAKIYYKNKMKFFRQLMNWLDSWDERLNPITLRELRCETRVWDFEVTVLVVWFLVFVYAFITLCIPELKNPLQKVQEGLFGLLLINNVLVILLPGSFVLESMRRSRRVDKLLNIVPLSPQQQVHGHWALTCIWSIFCSSISLPLIAFSQLIDPVSYVLLPIQLVAFFLSQIMSLVFISFSARIKQNWELALSFLAIFGFYLGLIVIIWRYVILLVLDQWQLVRNYGFFFVSLFILLPVILLLHGYIAYKLSVYGFKTWRKPFWRSLLLNMTVYTLFHLTAATIWVAIAVAVFYL
jgi:hypothetical protein